jgi:tetraacyldisaccharide-1-P 4'-kinase
MGVGGTPPGVVGAIVLDDGLQHLRMARDLEAGAYTRSR